MIKFRYLCLLLVTLALVSLSAFSADDFSKKCDVVKKLYLQFPPAKMPKSPVISNQKTSTLKAFFNKSLADLIAKDNECAVRQGVCKLDFDPIYNSQDNENVEVAIYKDSNLVFAKLDYKEAGVMKIQYELLKENGVYKINNIIYPNGKSLRNILK